jgi:Family of unknown function (DUF6134)
MTKPHAPVLIGLLLAAQAAVASNSSHEFEVLLDSRPIGTHRFDVSRASDGTHQVTSVAAFDVKFLGFNAYRYRHQATERWSRGCLAQIDASTDDNGKRLRVARELRDGCMSSYAYWDPEHLLKQRELLNPQTGEIDAVKVETVGEETLMVRGAPVRADRYRLRSEKFVIDLWYSKTGEWLQLDSSTDSKRQLRYRLRDSNARVVRTP